MTGQQILFIVLGVAVVIGTTYGVKSYLSLLAERGKTDYEIEKNREETRRAEIVATAAARDPILSAVIVENQKLVHGLLRRLAPDDQLVVDDVPIIDGEQADRLTRSGRPELRESRLDADFVILSVQSGSTRDGYKLKVRNVESDNELAVHVPEGTLNEAQIRILQDGEWGKRPISMKLNIKKKDGRIISAILTEAGLFREPEEEQEDGI